VGVDYSQDWGLFHFLMVPLSEDRLFPLVLSAYGFQGSSFSGRLENRQVADFEVEFLTEGGGSQIIGGTSYPMVAGDVVWRRPGTLTRGILPYSCFTVILDLEGVRRPGREPYLMNRAKTPQPDFYVALLENIPAVLTPSEPEEFRRIFEGLVRHFVNPGPGTPLHLRALAFELLARLAEESHAPVRSLPAGASVRLRSLALFLRRNFHRRLVLDDMAREAGLSPTYLHSQFTRALGVTPREYLTQVRMARARELLAATRWPAAEVAQACGIENVPYFFTLFHRQTGLTPGEFRQKHSPLEG